jgi:hypothetical protein
VVFFQKVYCNTDFIANHCKEVRVKGEKVKRNCFHRSRRQQKYEISKDYLTLIEGLGLGLECNSLYIESSKIRFPNKIPSFECKKIKKSDLISKV